MTIISFTHIVSDITCFLNNIKDDTLGITLGPIDVHEKKKNIMGHFHLWKSYRFKTWVSKLDRTLKTYFQNFRNFLKVNYVI